MAIKMNSVYECPKCKKRKEAVANLAVYCPGLPKTKGAHTYTVKMVEVRVGVVTK